MNDEIVNNKNGAMPMAKRCLFLAFVSSYSGKHLSAFDKNRTILYFQVISFKPVLSLLIT